MYMIKLTENELKNLIVFLKRVNLTGEEAFEYMNIINKINESEKIDDEIKS